MLFNLFTVLPFTVCLFWTAVLFFDRHRENAAQHVLTVFMAVSALLYLCHAVFFNHVASLLAASECVYAFCNIAVFPIYFLYICRLTDRGGLAASNYLALLPAAVIGVWTTLQHLLLPDDVAAENLRITVMRVFFMVQLVPISLICYRHLRRFDNEIANYYADTENRSVRPTQRMMWLLVAGALMSGVVNFLGREYFDDSELLICVPSLMFSVLLFGVGYVGMRQEFCIDDLMRDESRSSSSVAEKGIGEDAGSAEDMHRSGVVASGVRSHIIRSLDKLMEDNRLYLRADLRLSEVAAFLGVGRTTLSQRINQELQLSFSDYINGLRIDYACQLLSAPDAKRMSLSALAEECGFSSDSSFYRAFRRCKGVTPKKYMECRR